MMKTAGKEIIPFDRKRQGLSGQNQDAAEKLDIASGLSKNKVMKITSLNRYIPLLLMGSLLLFSCARPVLNKSYLREGDRKVSFTELRENPGQYKGTLFVFGGVIVRTKLVKAGSQIEAMHVPVDASGYFEESGLSEGRFLALLPKDGQMLDPAVYSQGRRVTIAAEFVITQKGMVDDMEYQYPFFRIKAIYLWPRGPRYYYAPPDYYDPWFYPYPYYYWDPWWDLHYFRSPVPAQPREVPRSSPPPSPPPARREQGPMRDR